MPIIISYISFSKCTSHTLWQSNLTEQEHEEHLPSILWLYSNAVTTNKKACDTISYPVKNTPYSITQYEEKAAHVYVVGLTWIMPASPWLSIFDATTDVSPMTTKRGTRPPSTPVTMEPVWTPIRSWEQTVYHVYLTLNTPWVWFINFGN